ncbi:hypothetical protein B0H12DRAFT_1072327 [Mycena haematopus]|nr:hypothetical protein B0H12DRAFT_1072327 [Mycena haematopus]
MPVPAVHTLAQSSVTEVTLWQFGQGRLLSGQATLPLQPLGTASDGSATMYLYQVLNPVVVTTVVDATFTTQTIPSPTPRTIVASASGWVEVFGKGNNIACGLIDSTFGECFIGTATAPANSGAPTPEVLRVVATTSTPSPTSPSRSIATSAKQPQSVGPIVGGAVAGSVLLLLSLTLCILLLRRRRRRLRDTVAARGYEQAAPEPSNISGKQPPLGAFLAGPQLELALSDRDDVTGVSQVRVASHRPTMYSVALVVQNDQREQEEPPAYPGRTVKG